MSFLRLWVDIFDFKIESISRKEMCQALEPHFYYLTFMQCDSFPLWIKKVLYNILVTLSAIPFNRLELEILAEGQLVAKPDLTRLPLYWRGHQGPTSSKSSSSDSLRLRKMDSY